MHETVSMLLLQLQLLLLRAGIDVAHMYETWYTYCEN
jgi:hypothetical protein